MANNPISFSDPDGDDFGLSIAIGVGISVLINGINNLRNDQDFFNNWGMAALFGGFSGAFGYGIGNIFDMGILGSGFWNEAARAAVHGYVGGVFAMAQGGKFTHGFASGGIGSGVGSAIGAHGKAAGWSRSGTNFAMIGGAGLSGGIGSSISGGSFWKGFGIGATVGAVNHAMGEIMNGGGGATDPELTFDEGLSDIDLVLFEVVSGGELITLSFGELALIYNGLRISSGFGIDIGAGLGTPVGLIKGAKGQVRFYMPVEGSNLAEIFNSAPYVRIRSIGSILHYIEISGFTDVGMSNRIWSVRAFGAGLSAGIYSTHSKMNFR